MTVTAFELATAAVVGVLTHKLYFNHGERDLQAPGIVRVHLALFGILLVSRVYLGASSLQQAIQQSLIFDTVYLASLLSSIAIFRIFFSPLGHVPGPLHLRWTKLTHVVDTARGKNCKDLHRLRSEYGDVVRTGPNEVTVFGTNAYYQVHGSGTTCTKAAYYDILYPAVSVQTTRDPAIHAKKHKVWDQAMGMRALERLEPAIYGLAEDLISKLRFHANETVNMTQWIEYYTFDLMGLAGMGRSFGNLSRGEDPILSLFRRAHRNLGLFAPAPWLQHLFMSIPFVNSMGDLKDYNNWANAQMSENIQSHSSARTDVMKHVIDDALTNGGVQQNINDILGEFIITVVAGSDPPWQTLVNLVYYLTRYPDHVREIRKELASIDIRDYHHLQRLSHLNACIYETLRLHPGVPSGSYRLPPNGGMTLNKVYIPDGTTIVTPLYSLQRSKDTFVHPDDWIPNRFTSNPELVLDGSAFLPWGTGKHTCLGKNLSLMEMRVAIAKLVTAFDFSFAPDGDNHSVISQATDFFTAAPGPLHIVLSMRNSGE